MSAPIENTAVSGLSARQKLYVFVQFCVFRSCRRQVVTVPGSTLTLLNFRVVFCGSLFLKRTDGESGLTNFLSLYFPRTNPHCLVLQRVQVFTPITNIRELIIELFRLHWTFPTNPDQSRGAAAANCILTWDCARVKLLNRVAVGFNLLVLLFLFVLLTHTSLWNALYRVSTRTC